MQSSDIYNFLLDLLIFNFFLSLFIILHLVVNIYLFIC